MRLTENFSKSEFDCKCGCTMPNEILRNVIHLAFELQKIRNKVGVSIKVNSGYRCPSHNKKIGGSPKSQHLEGKASDIVISGYLPTETYLMLNDMMNNGIIKEGGLGKYATFTHYDIRGIKARW